MALVFGWEQRGSAQPTSVLVVLWRVSPLSLSLQRVHRPAHCQAPADFTAARGCSAPERAGPGKRWALSVRGIPRRPKQVTCKHQVITEHHTQLSQDQHFVEATRPGKGLCVLGTLLKAPGYGIGVVPMSGKGGDLTYSADNFKKAILLNIPLLNSSALRRPPRKGRHNGFVFLRLK